MPTSTKIAYSLILTGLIILLIAPAISFAKIDTPEKVIALIDKVGGYIFQAFFIVAIIFIVIAAFNFLTAQGDVEKVKNARSQILWAAVAIAVALISTGAVKIIESIVNSVS